MVRRGKQYCLARLVGQGLTKVWGQPVVIVNQAGAGGSLGAARAANSAADGYTLFFLPALPFSSIPLLTKSLGYDPQRDFEPVVRTDSPIVLLANPKLPVSSIKELIALAKRRPGKIQAGTSGYGATAHLAITEFSRLANIQFLIVPYNSGPPMLTAMLPGEEIQIGFSDVVPALPLDSGR